MHGIPSYKFTYLLFVIESVFQKNNFIFAFAQRYLFDFQILPKDWFKLMLHYGILFPHWKRFSLIWFEISRETETMLLVMNIF